MIGIVLKNAQLVQPLKPGLFRSLSTKSINLRATNFEAVQKIVSCPENFIVDQAKPVCSAMDLLQKKLLVPHLKNKVDLIGGSHDESACLIPDRRLLRDCESIVLGDASFDSIRPFLLEMIRGMLDHSQHRTDIIKLNHMNKFI